MVICKKKQNMNIFENMRLDDFIIKELKMKERRALIITFHLLVSNCLDYHNTLSDLIDFLNIATKKDILRKMCKGKGEKAYSEVLRVLKLYGFELINHPPEYSSSKRVFYNHLSWAPWIISRKYKVEKEERESLIQKLEQILKAFNLLYEDDVYGLKRDKLENVLRIYNYKSKKEIELGLEIDRVLLEKMLIAHGIDKRDLKSPK